jgi:hypothetical protein
MANTKDTKVYNMAGEELLALPQDSMAWEVVAGIIAIEESNNGLCPYDIKVIDENHRSLEDVDDSLTEIITVVKIPRKARPTLEERERALAKQFQHQRDFGSGLLMPGVKIFFEDQQRTEEIILQGLCTPLEALRAAQLEIEGPVRLCYMHDGKPVGRNDVVHTDLLLLR